MESLSADVAPPAAKRQATEERQRELQSDVVKDFEAKLASHAAALAKETEIILKAANTPTEEDACVSKPLSRHRCSCLTLRLTLQIVSRNAQIIYDIFRHSRRFPQDSYQVSLQANRIPPRFTPLRARKNGCLDQRC